MHALLLKSRRLWLCLALPALAVLPAAWACAGSAGTDDTVVLEAGARLEVASLVTANLDWSRSYRPLAFPEGPAPALGVKLPILMYHHVGEAPPGADALRRSLTVPAAEFDAQMGYLKQAGYNAVSATQLFRALFHGVPLPPNPVLLTFDDGYLDNFTVAAPILAKYGFPGTFYIVTDRIGATDYMSREQIVELDRMGMDIGSHSVSHRDLTSLPPPELNHELKDAADAIASLLGHPVYWFCYPSGKHNDGVKQAARGAGYLLAVTTTPGSTQNSGDPFGLLRFRIMPGMGLEGFRKLVE